VQAYKPPHETGDDGQSNGEDHYDGDCHCKVAGEQRWMMSGQIVSEMFLAEKADFAQIGILQN
jgi:hypothetical protein